MAYVPDYTYDIFISYAHLDNFTAFNQERGWIEHFHEELRLLLARRIGRMDAIKIWWDNKKLDGSILFDNSIEEGIQRSAVMLCLLSPGYVESEYCRKELDLFYKKAQQEKHGLAVGDRSRVLNVLLNNIPYQEWPKELGGTTGFPFYQADDNDDWSETLDPEHQDFRKHLQDLRDAIVNILKQLKESPAPQPTLPEKATPHTAAPTLASTTSAPAEAAMTIYFGDVADSLRTVRKRTITELEKEGYHIVCDVPPPYEKEEHERVVKGKIEESFLNVHLLDQFPGREIDGEEAIWYPQRQVEIGLQTEKPQLIWMPAGTDIEVVEEEQYKTFIQGLESGKQSAKKIDIIRGAKSELTQQIINLVEQLKKEQEQLVKTGMQTASNTAVLLDTHFSDQLYAWKVGESLLENGIQAFLNPVEDDPRRNVNSWEERMSQVNKLVFFYGKVSWDWVKQRMSAALQSIVTNFYPVEEFIVFLVPPHKNPGDIALRQWVLKVNVINNSDTPQLDAQSLQLFVDSIKKTEA